MATMGGALSYFLNQSAPDRWKKGLQSLRPLIRYSYMYLNVGCNEPSIYGSGGVWVPLQTYRKCRCLGLTVFFVADPHLANA
jgi:hypothetical protein